MLARHASRTSLWCSVIVASLGVLVVAIVVMARSHPTSTNRVHRCGFVREPAPRPVVTKVVTACDAWTKRDVAAPTRLCTENETARIQAAVDDLGIQPRTRPLEAATRIVTVPLGCRPNIPEAARMLAKASVSAMGMKAFAAAEQFAALSLVYADPLVRSDTVREVQKALERERKALCRRGHIASPSGVDG